MTDVKPLLLASMAAHQKAKGGRKGVPRQWGEGLEAINLLGQAMALDPRRADPAWAECQAQFEKAKQIPVGKPFWEAFMTFYGEQFG